MDWTNDPYSGNFQVVPDSLDYPLSESLSLFPLPFLLSSPPQIRSIWKARVNIGIEPDRQGFEFLFKYDLLKKKKRKEVFLVEKKREKEGGVDSIS